MKRCAIHNCPMLPIGERLVCVVAYDQYLQGKLITDFALDNSMVNLIFDHRHVYPLWGWKSNRHAHQSSGAADGLMSMVIENYLVQTMWSEDDSQITIVIGDQPDEGQWQLCLDLDP
ncbi:MAG: hypothetical protein U9Q82_12965 [Chloroflexota bacterium]|nr:hypothetical protein [Chloroflexota bacterium]